MAPFKFPPPPPPPKATSSEQPYANQRGGHNRGGADRGRGRGGNQNRGGSFHSVGENTRGGHGHNRGRGDGRGRGGQRGGQGGGQQHNRGGGNHNGGFNANHGQHQSNAPPIPASPHAYVNPAFAGNAPTQSQAQQPFDPNALAQVMSYMSTPAGVQSMAAFANHMTGAGNASPSYPPPSSPQYQQPDARYSPSQHAGQKRKLGDRNNNTRQQGSKPPRAKAAVPPQVPSFGFALPPPSAVQPGNKKRRVNLGLSKQHVSEESSDEEDIDEEAAFAQKLKGGGFVFEHEGEMISVQTDAELAEWRKDRRRHFPTEKSKIEKAEEAARKRAAELDFLRKLQGKPPKEHHVDTQVRPTKSRYTSKEDQAKKENEKQRQEELAALRKKLHESMIKKQAAPRVDLGLGYASDTASEEESSVLSESSIVSSSEESEEDSESGSDDSDEAPAFTSSKIAPPPVKVPPPHPAAPQSHTKSTNLCSNWKRSGKCPYISKCKYQHPPKEDENKLVGLYERMVEQELVKADQLALDAIKYLGQHGFLG
ncbi:NUFIP1 multi-domain protein [Pyrenophora tritici-repentis]|uniref:NUFIP1 multi-domain protein n=2 Tax=Pyrenophora tritici-repentis TaxID=45151 RepID=A0A2W1DID7_9PLEO|nr:uncharacterized protein PTRG_07897 [Pyrenophora tritici-repentis Pt-1C-BFP]KAF7446055.1 zf-CCCH domain containing protein [Pyrenophora tritici-repentis]EDU50816.1 predicted protein [Pyrenophora tritici-repentis Pt-1C-BFP]KAF7567162.1 NUFIP1 multi-domain protein [Pyrenophora tritici-repentis]KAI0577256.1 zf-CCCH domain-containing protein [Pyrenophora tritici-repentis]KAI1515617.1 zf-CCCH domain containing protein [Pyrenophora tritici-repentis]